jgi:hypothetical protein
VFLALPLALFIGCAFYLPELTFDQYVSIYFVGSSTNLGEVCVNDCRPMCYSIVLTDQQSRSQRPNVNL